MFHHEVAVEPLGLAQHHQVADVGAPVVGDQQHTVEPKRVEQRQNVGRDVLLRPFVRSGARTSRSRAGPAR